MGRAGWTPGHSDSGNQGAGPSHLPSAGRGGQRAPRPGPARPSREGSSSGRPGRACSSSGAREPVVLEPLQRPRLPPAPGPGEDAGTGQTPASRDGRTAARPVVSPSLRGPASLVFLRDGAKMQPQHPRMNRAGSRAPKCAPAVCERPRFNQKEKQKGNAMVYYVSPKAPETPYKEREKPQKPA